MVLRESHFAGEIGVLALPLPQPLPLAVVNRTPKATQKL